MLDDPPSGTAVGTPAKSNLSPLTHAGYYALREASRQAFSEMLSQALELKGDMQNGL